MRSDDIHVLVEALGTKVKGGDDNIYVSCPFAPWTHESGGDTSGSMSIKANEYGSSSYYCWACKERGGSVVDLVWSLRSFGLDDEKFWAAVEVADREVEEKDSRDPDFDRVVKSSVTESASIYDPPVRIVGDRNLDVFPKAYKHRFLSGRGVSERTAELFDIRFDRSRSRLVVPVRDYSGNLVGAVGRAVVDSVKPKYYNYFGFSRGNVLFGEHLLDLVNPLIVCEGIFDTVVARSYGLNAVSVMGSSATRAQIRRILSTELPVYILFDGDEAGRDGATKLSSVLRRAGASVKVIELPDGEDPGSMSIEMAERIKEVIDDADVEIPPMFR